MHWVVPPSQDASGKWRFRLGFPDPKHEIILVVTITGKGDNPRYTWLTHYFFWRFWAAKRWVDEADLGKKLPQNLELKNVSIMEYRGWIFWGSTIEITFLLTRFWSTTCCWFDMSKKCPIKIPNLYCNPKSWILPVDKWNKIIQAFCDLVLLILFAPAPKCAQKCGRVDSWQKKKIL